MKEECHVVTKFPAGLLEGRTIECIRVKDSSYFDIIFTDGIELRVWINTIHSTTGRMITELVLSLMDK